MLRISQKDSHCVGCGGWCAGIEGGPEIAGRGLRQGACDYWRKAALMHIGQVPVCRVDGDCKRIGGAQWAVELVSRMLRLIGDICVEALAVTAAHRAVATIETAKRQSAHLTVMNTAGEQAEQDAGVQHPCNECPFIACDFHRRDFTTSTRFRTHWRRGELPHATTLVMVTDNVETLNRHADQTPRALI